MGRKGREGAGALGDNLEKCETERFISASAGRRAGNPAGRSAVADQAAEE